MEKIDYLCEKYHLGKMQRPPELVTGGLLHKMYHVHTDKGEYAIKQLNPDIMKRPEALQNMINSEKIAEQLKAHVPLVAAREFDGSHVIETDGNYYFVFDWLVGVSVYMPDISVHHCEQIGRILGKIHAADVKVLGVIKDVTGRNAYDWMLLLEKAKSESRECYLLLKENIADIINMDKLAINALKEADNNQVISHRDFDPKNVMWKELHPYIIDWEAAGYINPYQELLEVLNYWAVNENGEYDETKKSTLMRAYGESMDIQNVDFRPILYCSIDGMLGWLYYNCRRAIGMEGTKPEDRTEGVLQVRETILELKKCEKRFAQFAK